MHTITPPPVHVTTYEIAVILNAILYNYVNRKNDIYN